MSSIIYTQNSGYGKAATTAALTPNPKMRFDQDHNNEHWRMMKNILSPIALVVLVGCVDPSASQPSRAVRPASATRPANAASAIIGQWEFPQVAPDVSPVGMTLNANSTYELESEAAVFEKGHWSVSGNQIRFTPVAGKPYTNSFQFLSKDKVNWAGKHVITRIH
jgi:hypothetical protein